MGTQSSPLLEESRLKLKVCLAGETAVGKTSLVRRFVFDQFEDRYIPTLGTKVTKKDLRMVVDGDEEERVTLLIWDIMGDKGIRDLLKDAFFHRAQGIFLVADVTRPDTLDQLDHWKRSIEDVTGPVPVTLLVNKTDLEEEATLPEKDVKALGKEWDCPYLLTSAKTGDNVEAAFEELARRIIEGS